MRKLITILLFIPFGLMAQTVDVTVFDLNSNNADIIQVTDSTGFDSSLGAFIVRDSLASTLPGSIWSIGTETGTVSYNDSISVSLSGTYPSITSDAFLVYLKRIPDSGSAKYYINGIGGVTLRHSAGTVTLSGIVLADTLASTDVYELGINAPKNSEDYDLDALRGYSINPDWTRYEDPVTLVSAQDLTASYADFGSEISMEGFNTIGLYIIHDINDSRYVYLKILGKDESGGTFEYEIDGISEKSLWTGNTSDFNKIYEFKTDKIIKYAQVQAYADTVGSTAGDLTIKIMKSHE